MIVSGPVYIIAKNTILHESNLLQLFMTLYHACSVIISNRWLAHRPTSREAVLLARLVKVDIVSPYRGILINAGMGNPTVPFTQPLGIGEWGGVQYSLPL